VELINEVSGELYLKFPFTGENPFSHIFVAKVGGAAGAQDPIYITCDYGQLKALSTASTAAKEGDEDGDSSKKVKVNKREEDGEEDNNNNNTTPAHLPVSGYVDGTKAEPSQRKKKKKKKSKDGEGTKKKSSKKKG